VQLPTLASADTGEQGREIVEPLGNDVDHFPFPLDLAANAHHRSAKHDAAVLLEDIGPDNEIGDIGLVLERDEHDALGGTGVLADFHAGS